MGAPLSLADVNDAIAEIEERIKTEREALDGLKAYRTYLTATSPDRQNLKRRHTSNGAGEPSNKDAVLQVLGHQYPEWTVIAAVAELGREISGRALNINSVRWVLREAEQAGEVEKKKEGGRALYRIKK